MGKSRLGKSLERWFCRHELGVRFSYCGRTMYRCCGCSQHWIEVDGHLVRCMGDLVPISNRPTVRERLAPIYHPVPSFVRRLRDEEPALPSVGV